jgi:hypothetical protein
MKFEISHYGIRKQKPITGHPNIAAIFAKFTYRNG